MSSEEPSASKPSLSLADRITKPDATPDKPNDEGPESSSEPTKPSTSWADDVASPTEQPPDADKKVEGDKVEEEESKAGGLADAQLDGASVPHNGSNLQEPDYSVEVKLSDVRADPNNPLYSVSSFEDMAGL